MDSFTTKLGDIINIEKVWKSILKNDISGEIKTFNDLLIQDKLPMPIYNKKIIFEPEPDNLSEGYLSEIENEPNNELDSDVSGTENEPKDKSVKRKLNTAKNIKNDRCITVPVNIESEYFFKNMLAFIILSTGLFFTFLIGFNGLVL